MTRRPDLREPRRPRLAGEGMLMLPAAFVLGLGGEDGGMVEIAQVDPFGWTTDNLLLAESFARLNLGDRAAAMVWSAAHGTVGLWTTPATDADVVNDARPAFANIPELDADEQSNVRWHLRTLARLSETRDTMQWEPAWGVVVLKMGSRRYLLGGQSSGVELRPPFDLVADPRLLGLAGAAEADSTAQRGPGVEHPLPQVSVSAELWPAFWVFERAADRDNQIVGGIKPLGDTWASMVEFERMLFEPYLLAATAGRFSLETEYLTENGRPRLRPRETRRWSSITSPIYLQLLEALRRITEGERGAATCRECKNSFLVLDARRKYFCNDRERYRYAQRQLRGRFAAQGLTARGHPRQVSVLPATPLPVRGGTARGDTT